MNYQATKAQQGYYRSLTGDWLPRGTSKSQASALIKKAKAGGIPKKRDVVSVYGWQFGGLAAECLKEELKGVSYAIDLNYRMVKGPFKTLAEAEQLARALYPDAEIIVYSSIRQQYMD